MNAAGGVTLPETVPHRAVTIVNSGPVGGLVAAKHLGRLLGQDRIITADMGGTSFDVGLIADGQVAEETTPFLDQGLPVHVNAVKVVTIGAGGGSIAWTDGHRLQVGPQSAGADPGPAAYGRGGTEPTVTDALVMLGIVDAENFFGGRHRLNAAAAERAVTERLATPLGIPPMDAAAGIYEVVTARMGDLIRKVTVESGHDPRAFCLVAYGGACAAHCAVFARQLGVRRVVLPYAGPVFSALGIALSDIVSSYVVSAPVPLEESAETAMATGEALAALEARARADLAAGGIAAEDEVTVTFRIDMRYAGQMNEVSLPWPRAAFAPEDVPTLREAFEAHYAARFGAVSVRRATPLELISFRAEAVRPTAKPEFARLFEPGGAAPRPARTRRVWQHGAGWVEAAIYDFAGLVPDAPIAGPAVIERDNTTVWLPEGATAALDVYGNIAIDPGAAA